MRMSDWSSDVSSAYLDSGVYRCRHRRADGGSYPVEVRLSFSRDEVPPVFMAMATDISERLAGEAKLEQMAHYDALTGLQNRVMLQDRLQQAWLAQQHGSRLLGVLRSGEHTFELQSLLRTSYADFSLQKTIQNCH